MSGSGRPETGRPFRPFLTKEPKLLLNDNHAGKPEGIHLMIGRRPQGWVVISMKNDWKRFFAFDE
jgi:hypothetical protein